MKYLVYRINRRTGKKYWRYSKTTDYWTGIKGIAYGFTKKGAQNIVEKYNNSFRRATWEFGIEPQEVQDERSN